uniref:ALMS motif domain-containing protein n=1 Tax=Panagrolaimus davidi TaxID=227884 RepID=A0A914PBC1_9BILA
MERKNVGKESHRHLSSFSSSSPPYCVPIPATLAHHQLRNLKRPAPISPELQAERKRRAELFEQTLARITAKKSSTTSSTTPSIFHSVQMLAEPG